MTNSNVVTLNIHLKNLAVDELRQWQEATDRAESKAWVARETLTKMGFDILRDHKANGLCYAQLKAIVTESLPKGALELLNCDPKTLIKADKPDPIDKLAKTTGNRKFWQQKPNSLMRDLARPYVKSEQAAKAAAKAKEAKAEEAKAEEPKEAETLKTAIGGTGKWDSKEFMLALFKGLEDKLTDVESADYDHEHVLDLIVEAVGLLSK